MYKSLTSLTLLLLMTILTILSAKSILADPVFPEYPLPGDIDHNRRVNLLDLKYLTAHWLQADCSEPNWCEFTDIDQNGLVNFNDISLLSYAWQASDFIRLDKEILNPLESVTISVLNVSDSCLLEVTSPRGIVHTLNGTIADGKCTATYTPSYLSGAYHVRAEVDGYLTETESFYVSSSGSALRIKNYQADYNSYYPGRSLTFTFDLQDRHQTPLSGFSPELSDTRYDSDSGRLSLLRRIMHVAEDGTITARIQLYFDTTGRWSHIYAGTEIKLNLYYKDGTALPDDITLAPDTENNADGHLSNNLTLVNGIHHFTTTVDTGFSGSDKISYVDIIIPPARSLSDVIFSLEYIKYNYNTGWSDRIYIREQYINVPGSGYSLTTGDSFADLGRLPIYLPLTPNENGLIYYSVHTDDPVGEISLTNGTISEVNGSYSNTWTWHDFVDTGSRFYVYVDKWGYGHAHSEAISMGIDPGFNEHALSVHNWNASSSRYFPDETIDFSVDLRDTGNTAVSGLTGRIADNVPDHNGGALYLLREVRDVFEDGSSLARLSWYFDTTGSWSDIYAGTIAEISLYQKDGITPLSSSVTLIPGFRNDDTSALSATVNGNIWQVQVNANFAGSDKIAYLDFYIPSGMAVSDIVLSVDHIKYNRNGDWSDRFVIAGISANESSFPRTLDGALQFQTGDRYPGLGHFPLKLSLNPNPNGFLFYKIDSTDIPECNINYGSLSETDGTYTNRFTWNDYIETTAKVYLYADKWWYNSASVSTPIYLNLDKTDRLFDVYYYSLDNLGYTFNDTRIMSASVADGAANPIGGLKSQDAITDLDRGKLSIVTQCPHTRTDPNHTVRLLVYFDTTGRWSDIYAGTEIQISIYGTDGKTAIPPEMIIQPGSSNADGFISTTLTDYNGAYQWHIRVDQSFAGADRQVFLDFICPDAVSSSKVIFAVESIKYFFNGDWADAITIRDQTVHQGSFPRSLNGQVEFTTGFQFGNLGLFPLYLSLNPGDGLIFPELKSSVEVDITGIMSETGGDYEYHHHFIGDEVGNDFETSLCISKYGYNNDEYVCTETIDLLFSGEPRYLGGLEDAPVLLNETWQKNLADHFFVEPDPQNVVYFSSHPQINIVGSQAEFTPLTVNDTLHDVVITAQSIIDPCISIYSDPFTLYAATCLSSYDCADQDPNAVNACVQYQCESYQKNNSFYNHPQGVDLQVLNKNITLSNHFPAPNEQIQICVDVVNTGTVYVWDAVVDIYLDDVNAPPIATETIAFLPITYMNMPFHNETVCIDWQVPASLQGHHKIWVEVSGANPLNQPEDMLSNNYAARDFSVNVAGQSDPAITFGSCPTFAPAVSVDTQSDSYGENCNTWNLLVPVNVRVCEDELVCGPVTGFEFSYWSTLYWPSWSGYCQEFDVPQEAITDFIRTYETLVGLGSRGAASGLPSLIDIPGLFDPQGWSDGWLPCHPEPTLFPWAVYTGVVDPDCGGLCPVSAWDCGQGVQFTPRFSSPYYNAYEFRTSGGARKVTRCHDEVDYIEIPVRLCFPGDDPNTPFNVPINLFGGAPGGDNNGYSGGGLGSGPAGAPPVTLQLAPPTDTNNVPLPVSYYCTFCSTGTTESHSPQDTIHCEPGTFPSDAPMFMASDRNDPISAASLTRPENTGLDLGDIAPAFSLLDIRDEEVGLSDFYGREVLLVFGNIHCSHCRARLPLLQEISEHQEQRYKVILVLLGADNAAAQAYITANNLQFMVLPDPKHQTAISYAVSSVPEVYIIDPEGRIKYSGPRQGQIIWYQIAGSLESNQAQDSSEFPDFASWAECGLFETQPDPYTILNNSDQPADLDDLRILALRWLLDDPLLHRQTASD